MTRYKVLFIKTLQIFGFLVWRELLTSWIFNHVVWKMVQYFHRLFVKVLCEDKFGDMVRKLAWTWTWMIIFFLAAQTSYYTKSRKLIRIFLRYYNKAFAQNEQFSANFVSMLHISFYECQSFKPAINSLQYSKCILQWIRHEQQSGAYISTSEPT